LTKLKAHRRVQPAAPNPEDGRLTDTKGRIVNFKNTLLIMTSNIGSKVIEVAVGLFGCRIKLITSTQTSLRL